MSVLITLFHQEDFRILNCAMTNDNFNMHETDIGINKRENMNVQSQSINLNGLIFLNSMIDCLGKSQRKLLTTKDRYRIYPLGYTWTQTIFCAIKHI